MSDGNGPAQALEDEHFKVNSSDFMRYLNGVNMNTACSECGAEFQWSVDFGNDAGNDPDPDHLTVYRMNFAKAGVFRTFYAMNCDNCGSYRHIYAQKVVDWIAANPGAEA